MDLFYTYLVIMNAIGFLIMLADKKKAIRGAWRIPERTLMAVAILGGSIGCLLGMKLFRHKTKHLKFTIGVPLILALQVVLGVVLLSIKK